LSKKVFFGKMGTAIDPEEAALPAINDWISGVLVMDTEA